jgi:hypothetical protein
VSACACVRLAVPACRQTASFWWGGGVCKSVCVCVTVRSVAEWRQAAGSTLTSLGGLNDSQRHAIAAAIVRSFTLWQVRQRRAQPSQHGPPMRELAPMPPPQQAIAVAIPQAQPRHRTCDCSFDCRCLRPADGARVLWSVAGQVHGLSVCLPACLLTFVCTELSVGLAAAASGIAVRPGQALLPARRRAPRVRARPARCWR